MRPFYLFKRAGNIYYAQFQDSVTHRRCAVRSMGTNNKEEALARAWAMVAESPRKQTAPSDVMNFIALLTDKSYQVEELLMLQKLMESKYPELKRTMAVSATMVTGQTEELSAGAPQRKTPLLSYITNFWDYENSEYVQDKHAHGQRIGQRHCYEQSNLVKYWREFFSETTTLEELSVEMLRDFEKYLQKRHENPGIKNANGKPVIPLSTSTMKNIIRCGGISFGWAVKQGYIKTNPEQALTNYTTVSKERGILSPEEARKLFKYGTWEDERYRVASLVAMITGLRIGEVQAIRLCDIGDTMLYVRNSWSSVDGLKCPKNGRERKVPIPPEIRAELLKLVSKNPHKNMFKEADGFVFWGTMPDKPIVAHQITDGFKKALYSIGITEKMRAERNIVFHSWRHFYATTMVNTLDERHAQMVLGHETPAMTKHYANHQREEDLEEMTTITNELFKKLMA